MSRTSHALLLLATLVAGCVIPLDPPPDGPVADGGVPRRGGVLRLAANDEPRTLDPAIGYDVASWSLELAIFSTLVDYDDGTTIVPSLATAWEVSADARRYRFTLRPEARFSTGRPMSADDVRFSIERLLRPTIHSQGAEFFRGIEGAEAVQSGTTEHADGIRVEAPHVVSFHLVAADPLFLHKLAMPFAAVVDHETIARVGDGEFARQPVGTGAFRLAEWQYGRRIRLERNPHYFRSDRPYLDGIDVTIGVSDQLEWLKFQRGELDAGHIPSAEYPRVIADARYQPLIERRTTLRTQYLGINCAWPPFDRLPVRQAMNLAVDRERLVQLADGRGVPAQTIVPPDMPGYRRRNARGHYDPAAARALLKAAGITSVETTLWTSSDEGVLRLAQSIQHDLQAVGIAVRIKPVTFPALIEAVRNPQQVPLFLLGWEADWPDPSNFLTVLLHGRNRGTNNHTAFADARVDALLDAGDATADPASRFRLFQRAERRILTLAPWVPLFHPVSVGLRHPRVRDHRMHPLRPSRYEHVWLAG